MWRRLWSIGELFMVLDSEISFVTYCTVSYSIVPGSVRRTWSGIRKNPISADLDSDWTTLAGLFLFFLSHCSCTCSLAPSSQRGVLELLLSTQGHNPGPHPDPALFSAAVAANSSIRGTSQTRKEMPPTHTGGMTYGK